MSIDIHNFVFDATRFDCSHFAAPYYSAALPNSVCISPINQTTSHQLSRVYCFNSKPQFHLNNKLSP